MYQAYRVSDFAHFVTISSEVVAMYNSLTFGVVFLNPSVSQIFSNTVGGIFNLEQIIMDLQERTILLKKLEERRLIFPVGQRLDLEDYVRTQNILRSQGIGILYLMLADGCNLACKYCYIERPANSARSLKLMSVEIIDQALETFSKILYPELEEPQVILYGGEPLLNRQGFKHSVEQVLKLKSEGVLPVGLGITLNTNGTLIDQEFAEFVHGKGIQISISLDGEKSIHDAMRPQISGQGSFDKVINTCRLLQENSIDFGFSITINGHNVHQLDKILMWIHETFNMQSIGFNILVDRKKELIGMSDKEYAWKVTEQLIRCFKICREKGIYEDRIMRKVDAFVRGYPYLYDCGAPGDQIVVTPDGHVGVCQAYCATGKYFVPLAELGNIANHPIWNLWRFRSPIYQKQCYNCIAMGLCGGGCPYSAELNEGSIWAVDEVFCTHAKGTLEFLIKDLYKQASTVSN